MLENCVNSSLKNVAFDSVNDPPTSNNNSFKAGIMFNSFTSVSVENSNFSNMAGAECGGGINAFLDS
jgi:hypothetical protein